MKMGIFPGWLLAGMIGYEIGEFPFDLCAAGVAIGTGLALAALARSSTALTAVAPPVTILLMRYVLLPALPGAAPQETAWLEHIVQPFVSATGLALISLLSIVGSYLLGYRYATTGEA